MGYTDVLSKLSISALTLAAIVGVYYAGYHSATQQWKAEKSQMQTAQAQQLAQAKQEQESIVALYNVSEQIRSMQSMKMQQYINMHRQDTDKYNRINAAYVSVLQHRADASKPVLSPTESAGLVQVSPSMVLAYTGYLYDYGASCANQLNALESSVQAGIENIKGVQ